MKKWENRSPHKSDYKVFDITLSREGMRTPRFDKAPDWRRANEGLYNKRHKELERWCEENIHEPYWLFGTIYHDYDIECWIPPKYAALFKLIWC